MVRESTANQRPPTGPPVVDQATEPSDYLAPRTRRGIGPTALGNDMVAILEKAAKVIEARGMTLPNKEFDHLDNLVRTLGHYVADLD